MFAFIFACHMGIYKKGHPNGELIRGAMDHFKNSPLKIFPITGDAWFYFTVILFLSAFIVFVMYTQKKSRERTMAGKEGGTAQWNTKIGQYNKTYSDPYNSTKANLYPSNNAILSDEIFLNLDTRKTLRNNNTMVIGGSGSGKSRFYVKPNLLQANSCYVCTDPAGELLASTGKFLEKENYEIKVFNLMQMRKSDRYNPFRYVHADKEEEVLTMIDCLIENTTSSNKKGGDQFWESAEKTLLRALCYYLIQEGDETDKNWSTVMFLLRQASVDEEHANFESPLDKLFNDLAKRNPNSIAVTQYQSFKQGAGKTLKSILISCSVRLSVFDIEQLANLTNEDDMDLTQMGMKKRAYFVITPQTTETFNFLVAMLYSQMFQVLYEEGNKLLEQGTAFNYEVRFLLDEFVNIGRIPQFDVKIATMRKYRISCAVILQAISQLEPLYEAWSAIVGNCDSMVFLGGIDKETCEYISDILGTQTIRKGSNSHGIGGKGGANESFSYESRKLINPDELAHMDNKNCIVNIRGLYPFYTRKFRYERHPNYKLTGDANPDLLYKNELDNMKPASYTAVSDNVQPQKTAFEIERDIRLAIKNSVKDGKINLSNIVSLDKYLKGFKSNTGFDIYDALSVIKTGKEEDISEENEKVLTTEIARQILKTLNANKAKQIILEFKNKHSQDNRSLLEVIKQEAPEEVDEWTRTFLTGSQ